MMMSITFGGISSGLPVNNIIDSLIAAERQPLNKIQERINKTQSRKSALSTLNTKATGLKSALFKFTSTSILEGNIFQKKKATSTDDKIISATTTENAAINQYSIMVGNLATVTKAKSVNLPGMVASASTRLSDIKSSSFTSGTFSIFVNGVKSDITVDAANDTLGDVLGRIDAVSGVNGATVDAQGRLQIDGATAGSLRFGSSGDTSNFLKLGKLDIATESTTPAGRTTGLHYFSTLDSSQSVSTPAAGFATAVTAGSTFKVGNATIDTTGKSLNQIITAINNNPDAGATATFNVVQNKLELNSTKTGQVAIQLQDVSGNFLSSMGLISGGNSLVSQTLGTNASFTINGQAYASTTNEVTETSTGLQGLTLKLNNTTTASVTVGVERNTTALTDAVREVVNQFNGLISSIDTETNSKEGRIGAQNSLRSLRSSLRVQMASGVPNNAFSTLSLVGIGTSAVTGGQNASATLNFDEAKFTKALTDDGDDLEALIKGPDGIFTKLQAIVDQAVKTGTSDSDRGLFKSIDQTFDNQIKRYRESITRGEERLEKRRVALQRQFAAMDTAIAQYQSQGSALNSLAARLNANN
jgi:flagellar hook-associated protein 2